MYPSNPPQTQQRDNRIIKRSNKTSALNHGGGIKPVEVIVFQFFFLLLKQFELKSFSGILTVKVNGQWVPYLRNFYSFNPILLKLYRCLVGWI